MSRNENQYVAQALFSQTGDVPGRESDQDPLLVKKLKFSQYNLDADKFKSAFSKLMEPITFTGSCAATFMGGGAPSALSSKDLLEELMRRDRDNPSQDLFIKQFNKHGAEQPSLFKLLDVAKAQQAIIEEDDANQGSLAIKHDEHLSYIKFWLRVVLGTTCTPNGHQVIIQSV